MSDQPSSSGPVSGVAHRYATALLESAQESGPGAIDQVEGDLDRFSALIAESPDLARLIKSPVFSSEQQVGAVTAILDRTGIGGLAGNFIKLVASKRRLFAIEAMITGYKALVAEKRGIVRAQVTVAEAPPANVVEDIKAALKGVAGENVVLDIKVDPSIIGGLIVKLGSRMMDASLRTKLNSIRLAMKEVG